MLHGSNLAGVVEILKKNKTKQNKEINHTSINVSWVQVMIRSDKRSYENMQVILKIEVGQQI